MGIVLTEVANMVLSTFDLVSGCGSLTLVLDLLDGRVDSRIGVVDTLASIEFSPPRAASFGK